MHNVEKNIVFYDGSCLLCSRTVRLLIRLDKKQVLTFSLVQGEYIGNFTHIIPADSGDSILFWDGQIMHHSSDAIIGILKAIQFPTLWIWFIRFFPRSFRNWVYRIIARNRYSWFGKKKECSIIQGEEAKKFLD